MSEFIREREVVQREEEKEQRDREKAKDTFQREERLLTRQKEKEDRDFELDREIKECELANQKEKQERDFQLEKLKIEEKERYFNLEKLKIENSTDTTIPHSSHCHDFTKPQSFKDGEDITAYFIRFERIAEMLQWTPDTWAIKIATLLQGQALEIYFSLDVTFP